MTPNERLALVRKTLKLTQREFAEHISVATAYIALMEHGGRKVNVRIMKLISAGFNVNLHWLETGKGVMFSDKPEQDVREIVGLYKKLNPFLKKFIIRQLLYLIKIDDE